MAEDFTPKRYFVTGATGFIGHRVAKRLLEQGHAVVALARSPHRARDLRKAGAVVVQGDILSRTSLRQGMDGVDGVFHLAGRYELGRRHHSGMEEVNVDGTRNVLRVMRELGISRGVYTSTTLVFGDTKGAEVDEHHYYDGPHLSEYARTKWIAHYRIAKSMIFEGLPLVIVQPGAVYGPGDRSLISLMLQDHLRGRLPAVPGGAAFSWAHADDVAEGHVRAMQSGRIGESYILSGRTHTLKEVVDVAAKICRRRPPILTLDPAVVRTMAAAISPFEGLVPVPSHYASETLRMVAGHTFASSSGKAMRDLGYEARTIHTGLKGTLTDLAARLTKPRADTPTR